MAARESKCQSEEYTRLIHISLEQFPDLNMDLGKHESKYLINYRSREKVQILLKQLHSSLPIKPGIDYIVVKLLCCGGAHGLSNLNLYVIYPHSFQKLPARAFISHALKLPLINTHSPLRRWLQL